MAILRTKRRNALPASSFGLPKQRKYPMEDRPHQINAKSRATQGEKAGRLTHAQASSIRAKANRLLHHH